MKIKFKIVQAGADKFMPVAYEKRWFGESNHHAVKPADEKGKFSLYPFDEITIFAPTFGCKNIDEVYRLRDEYSLPTFEDAKKVADDFAALLDYRKKYPIEHEL